MCVCPCPCVFVSLNLSFIYGTSDTIMISFEFMHMKIQLHQIDGIFAFLMKTASAWCLPSNRISFWFVRLLSLFYSFIEWQVFFCRYSSAPLLWPCTKACIRFPKKKVQKYSKRKMQTGFDWTTMRTFMHKCGNTCTFQRTKADFHLLMLLNECELLKYYTIHSRSKCVLVC